MEIALCLSGQPRFYKEGFSYIKDYIKKYDMDVFFHTWWSKENIGNQYEKAPWRPPSVNELLIKDNVLDNLVDMYKPKNYICDSVKKFSTDRIFETGYDNKLAYSNIKSTFYSMKQVVSLKMKYEYDNNIKYDFVIHTRFDNHIQNIPDITKLDKNFIYFQVAPYKIDVKTRPKIYDDIITICGGELYDIRYDIFDNIDNYYDKMIYMRDNNIDNDYLKQMGKFMNNEELLSFNMYDNNVKNIEKLPDLRSVVI